MLMGLWCLSLLLLPTKYKHLDSDIPYLLKVVSVSEINVLEINYLRHDFMNCSVVLLHQNLRLS